MKPSACHGVKRSRLMIATAVVLAALAFGFWPRFVWGDEYKKVHRGHAAEPSVEQEVRIGDLHALVVGLSTYKHSQIQPLNVSHKDAQDFAKFLESQDKLFRNINVKLLVNEEATKAQVEGFLYYRLQKAGKDDTIIVFLSGHGAEDPFMPGEFFFLTYDSDPDNLQPTAVHLTGLRFLKRLEAPRVILIADACHGAGMIERTGTKRVTPSLARLTREFGESSGRMMMTSSREDEFSLEMKGLPNSLFTHYLLLGLKGEADRDGDGIVTLHELYEYVYQRTKDDSDGRQHPQLSGRLAGVFPLSLLRDLPSVGALPPTRPPEAIPPPSPLGPGMGPLLVRIFPIQREVNALPDLTSLATAKVTSATKINLDAGNKGEPADMPRDSQNRALRFSGNFAVDGEGIFLWRLNFKHAARLHVDDKTLIDGEGSDKPISKTAYLHLAEGIHTIIVDSLQKDAEPILQLFVTPPNGPEDLLSVDRRLPGWHPPPKPYDVLWGQVFFFPHGDYHELPDFGKLSPIGRVITPTLNLKGGDGIPGLPARSDLFGVRYEGFFTVKGAGIFAFRLRADQNAKLTIGKHQIAQTTGQASESDGAIGWAFLQTGSYPITLDYFHPTGSPLLQLYVTSPLKEETLFEPSHVLGGYETEDGKVSQIPVFAYFLKEPISKIPNFNKLTPDGLFFAKEIDFPIDRGSREIPGVPKRTDWLGLRFYVKFSLAQEESGTYTFRVVCREAARLTVAKKVVFITEGSGKTVNQTGSVSLTAGSHEMFLDYYHGTGPNGLQLFITPPGGQERIFGFQ